MATTTPNYGWPVPTSTDYVKDGAAAIEALGDAIDATVFGLGSGILQVVSTTKTDTFTMSSSTFADITGLSATITPSATNSKIYVTVSLVSGMNINATSSFFQLLRDSTAIGIGDAAGSRVRGTTGAYSPSLIEVVPVSMSFLDSPSTTSAVTYKVQLKSSVNGQQSVINRSNTDTDSSSQLRGASTITLFEVAG
jgi:hypothetical protein